MTVSPLTERTAADLVGIVLAGIEREYPNCIQAVLERDEDLRPPRERTPAFFGCFDWHSAVHSHWTLVRLRRLVPEPAWIDDVEAVLDRRLSEENLAGEVRFLSEDRNRRFECPYGLAWLLQLAAELHECAAEGDTLCGTLGARLQPLVDVARDRLARWLVALPAPIRSGQHPQSAFAMGLIRDWCRTVGDDEFADKLAECALCFHYLDRLGPLHTEPSGYDFVSPCLAEADLLRRVMKPTEFADWLRTFLPGIPGTPGLPESLRTSPDHWLSPVDCPDAADGKLSHLNGLNLSRAWMLDGIAHGLPDDDPRLPVLLAASAEHAAAGLPNVTGEHYAGAHWLPSFATYLLTRRGIA